MPEKRKAKEVMKAGVGCAKKKKIDSNTTIPKTIPTDSCTLKAMVAKLLSQQKTGEEDGWSSSSSAAPSGYEEDYPSDDAQRTKTRDEQSLGSHESHVGSSRTWLPR